MPNQSDTTNNSGADILQQLQLSEISISQKSSKEFGLKMAQKIWGQSVSSIGGYYYNRNARFRKNRNYANGRIDIQAMFADRLQMDGKQNYIRLNWQTLQIVNRIISGLVGRWMNRVEKIQVQAVDNLSQKDKQEEYDQIEFIIANRAKLLELQQQSGVKIIHDDTDLPADKDELNLWQAQFQRLPEEILYELGCNDILASNGWFDVMKEKMLHDAAEVLLVGTYTCMDEQGVIHVEWIEPENMIYSSTKYPDFRDTTYRGKAPSLKISELRRKYGKEFNPNNPFALTEQELFKIAQTAKEYQTYTNLNWSDAWVGVGVFLRPYDEWNVRSIDFEIKTVDSEPYTITTSKTTSTTYTQKGKPVTSNGNPKKPSPNQKVVEDTNWNIYRGVYLPDNDILLEWGIKKNMIRPQDPKEVGNAEFSYSFYMPQNYEMRNMAIPEKIEAAVDGMILALLKMQQVVARMRPTGAAIDESALQNIDYGLGDAGNKDVDYKKLYDQTGDIYYRGIDSEGNRVPIPIQELANTGFLGQMDGLIKNYQFNYQTLKDELGEDPNLISAALQPRVTAGNVEVSQSQADNATDYIYRAYSECMKITARKISCLLKDSVTYGSSAYRNLIKSEDIGERIFSTDIRFLPTEQEIARFDAILQKAMDTTPELSLFIDPNRLIRVAKEDVKLGELLFRQGQKKMLLWKEKTAKENQDATFKAQVESGKVAEQERRTSMQMEVNTKGQIDMALSKEKQKEIILTGIFGMREKGVELAGWSSVEQEMIQNVGLPLFAENMSNVNAINQQAQQQQQIEPEQQMQQEQPQEELQSQPQQAA